MTPDGAFVVVATEDAVVRAFVVATGEKVNEAVAAVGGPWTMVMNAAGTLVALGGNLGRIRFLEIPSMQTASELSHLGSEPTAMAFSPDGGSLAVGGSDGSITYFDLANKRQVRRLRLDSGPVYALAFRPDGLALASGGTDRSCVGYFSWPRI
jgi:WD40 repeat protein